jgi:hypothetical protein
MKRVIVELKRVTKRAALSIELKRLKGYAKMLESEHKDTSQLNPISRIRMLIAIKAAYASGKTLADLGINQASELEDIIIRVEKLTNRDLEGKQEAFTKIGMDKDALYVFFQQFLHDLADEAARKRVNRIKAKEGQQDVRILL